MLAKLDSVIPTLSASGTLPTNDIIYSGNIAEWQKFGYSLMLRMAMRLTKIDAATAQKYAEKAYAGGVFASNADNAYITFDHANNYSNGNSSALQVQEDYAEVKWGKGVIDYLKVNNDPRLSVIAEIPQPGLKNAANESLAGDPTVANQNGMPNGYDGNGGATDISKAPGYPGATGTGADANPTGGYSRPTSAVYLGLNTPGFILTYAETELLLAEAAERGWNVGPSASTLYANGANGDGWPDLYIARGGYSLWEPHTPALQDQLYLNDGKGDLALTDGLLPDVSASSKSCVRACDYDGDGDIDLFVGCRVVPGQYPTAPQSFLLQNDGKGHFSIVSSPFDHIGMVSDAQWIDLDGDGRKDLVLCGEFMPVLVFMNTPGGFVDKTTDYFGTASPGFWNTLTVADVDGDGKEDLIAGNIGLNSCLKISDKQPAEFYYADFDHNGSIDPFLNFYIQGVSYPFVSRDELNQQIPRCGRNSTPMQPMPMLP